MSDEKYKKLPSHREAMRDEAAKTRSLRQCSTSNEHLDKAISWYLNIGFQDGADWQYLQDKARIEKLVEVLKIANDRNFDYDLAYTDSSRKKLQDWRGKCFEVLKEVGHER